MNKLSLLFVVALFSAAGALAESEVDTTALAALRYPAPAAWHTCGGVEGDWRATFATAVEHLGLARGVEDLSAAPEIRIAEPRLALVNVEGIGNMPSSKHVEQRGWMEVYDGQGHHLRLPIIAKGQGGYSLRFPKRNFSIQFCGEGWDEEAAPRFYIGEWVRQDGFHFKAFYTDFLRGTGEVAYKWYHRLVADRLPFWERGGYYNDSRALCAPDGFPCIVYHDGQFQGIYAWQLKKHRRNMNMKKDNALHIHLDGNLSDKNLFDGRVDWKQFEVRNPKGLITYQGRPYDGNYPRELLGLTPEEIDEAQNAPDGIVEDVLARVRSTRVKESVLALSRYKAELTALEPQGAEVVRREMAKRFDIESLIDYQVFFRVTMNGDGTLKNWQWFTYDGQRWHVAPYDLDQTMGLSLYGFPRGATVSSGRVDTSVFPLLAKYFAAEERERYIQLRQSGVLSPECVVPLIEDWHHRVGEEWYEMEIHRWPESPCYCPAICNPGWEPSVDWLPYDHTPDYRSSAIYRPGDLCKMEGRLWRAMQVVSGVPPFQRNTDVDSLARLVSWVAERLEYTDRHYQYHHNPTPVSAPHMAATPQAIYDLQGRRQPHLRPGLNIVRRPDGTTRIVLH